MSPRKVGFSLFLLSFVTPSTTWREMGYIAFLAVPALVFEELGSNFHNWQHVASTLGLFVGWLANFTVFFKLPAGAARLAIAAPWILYLTLALKGANELLAFIPFFPWAIGIGMIHWSRLKEVRNGAATVCAAAR